MRNLFVKPPRVGSWTYRVASLGFFGLVMYIIGNTGSFPASWYGRCLEGLGLAIFCSAVAALLLEGAVHDALLSQTQHVFEQLRDLEEVRKGADIFAIRDIVGRRVSRLREKCEHHIIYARTHQLRSNTGDILVLCVAAPDYLRNGSQVADLLFTELRKPDNYST